MLVTDSFVAQGLHTQIDLIISLSWASGSGSHSPASTIQNQSQNDQPLATPESICWYNSIVRAVAESFALPVHRHPREGFKPPEYSNFALQSMFLKPLSCPGCILCILNCLIYLSLSWTVSLCWSASISPNVLPVGLRYSHTEERCTVHQMININV